MRQAQVLATLADEGIDEFRPEDLRRLLDIDTKNAQAWAFRLHDRGITDRLRKGLYRLRPVQDWGRQLAKPAAHRYDVALSLAPEEHYLAYYSAMEIHRMTQQPLNTVFVAVKEQRRPRTLGRLSIRFITLTPARFFGVEDRMMSGIEIPVSDLQRTIIDGADRPDLCGGIVEFYRGLIRRRHEINGTQLLAYLDRLKAPITVKRLGYLLETAGADQYLVEELHQRVKRTKRYQLLDPATTSVIVEERNQRWELRLNVSTARLRATQT